jgi:hypothetical protein
LEFISLIRLEVYGLVYLLLKNFTLLDYPSLKLNARYATAKWCYNAYKVTAGSNSHSIVFLLVASTYSEKAIMF